MCRRDSTWQCSRDFEAKVMALTAAEVNAAFRKYIDPDGLTLVVAADSRKATAAESAGCLLYTSRCV